MKRKGDGRKEMHFRVDRFYRANGKWYFLTRGGTTFGPFDTKKEAETELEYYLGLMNPPPPNE